MTECYKPYDPDLWPNPFPSPDRYNPSSDEFGEVAFPVHLHLARLKERMTCDDKPFDASYIVTEAYRISTVFRGEPLEIEVPRGMITDLASVPWWARWFAGRVGPHLEASIVHDWLYIAWVELRHEPTGADRRFADDLMYQIMKDAGMKRWAAWIIWFAVRIGGSGPFFKEESKFRYIEPHGAERSAT